MHRTNTCGDLRISDVEKKVTLSGWVQKTRKLGGLNIDSVLPFEEAVVCYRVITGACNFGTTEYKKKRLPKPHKEEYSVGEIIELTRDEYGGRTFLEFFTNKIKTQK